MQSRQARVPLGPVLGRECWAGSSERECPCCWCCVHVQVNEFAKNLREDKVKLPLNDRSRELTAQVKQLKDQVRGLTTGIQLQPVAMKRTV